MRAIAEGLFTDETPPRLIGGKDRETGRIVFPCPSAKTHEPVPLASEGTLWSYTVQRYRPKTPPYAGPDAFSPWVVAYVELPGQVIVEAPLYGVAFEKVTIGMPVRFSPAPLNPQDADGVFIPAFVAMGDTE
ncbi:Zn-ribbon domain-containing OB-fold protein [Novosphingobium sp. AP12]|uniref:Zn-ribbon domain-containing OB-fold protein n=1 Tax=Novosphingobium sp. AP12 TaxID=1144305 RepID=UPI0002721A66|nr:OB-fold domain-containing protein [Novosphingobium sp. AP12]EJL22187.1 putative nucleic-acid-binding protein containing a Zn-ribbon [Novosphingobium sp. AP12]